MCRWLDVTVVDVAGMDMSTDRAGTGSRALRSQRVASRMAMPFLRVMHLKRFDWLFPQSRMVLR
jgi:hypothetical protein